MKHLLSIADLNKTQAISILDTATELARVSDGQVKKLPTLRGRTIVNLFAEDSTRTNVYLPML
jgi:aspartate carbamoyltransferase catalytic subunit